VSPRPSRCPICGRGTLRDIADDAAPSTREPVQRADSRELLTYTCGHEVEGASLDTADADALEVERRSAAETVDPPPSS
jgi:hypothetical protein